MSLKGKIWIENQAGVNLGKGRVVLLKMIGEKGSLSKAATAINISYRKAWEQVREMNAYSSVPLVELSPGGKGGGGAKLTPKAHEIILMYEQLERDHKSFLKEKEIEFSQLWR